MDLRAGARKRRVVLQTGLAGRASAIGHPIVGGMLLFGLFMVAGVEAVKFGG
ncbi:MAG: hypothetical protein ACO3EP_05830 [Phycisphaerales bacterium]